MPSNVADHRLLEQRHQKKSSYTWQDVSILDKFVISTANACEYALQATSLS